MNEKLPAVGVMLPTMSAAGAVPGDPAVAARHAEERGLESVWVVDQLIAGTGDPFVDSVVALSAAAAATSRIRLGFGVAILPLHPLVWLAKQVGSLQHISGDRVILGVGAGGDRHDLAWLAAGVPRRERGKRTDAALRLLPDLLAGRPTRLGDGSDSPEIQLAPAVTVPPIVVGGMSDAALRRAVDADGWFLLPALPDAVADAVARLGRAANDRGRPTPAVTASLMVAFDADPAMPDGPTLISQLTDPRGMYGIPREVIPNMLVRGGPAELAALLPAYADAGASRLVISVASGDWYRQVDLVADAVSLRR
jgi:alkanesulfonate monooxygenase SsuD/methylene tetrahydromethanopterin reductase-like flavin-dependent oxidoreductase (luciferase family)